MEPVRFASLYPADSRHKEISQILEFIKTGASAQITGIPGIGRATVLELLSYNNAIRTQHLGDNQKWFHFVLLNCAEIKNRSLLDATKFIFLSLADSLRDRGLKGEHDKLHEIFKEHAVFNDELVLFQGLKEALDFLTLEKEFTIVFSFDRFEEYIPSLTPEFFSHLRVLRDRAKYRFSAIFSTPRPLEELLDESVISDFYEFLSNHIVYLSICDQPSLDFRIAYLQKTQGKTIDPQTISEIQSLTAGHGKLTRIALEEYLAQNPQDNLLTFLLGQKSVQRALFEIWNFLTPAEQQAITSSTYEDSFLKKAALIQENKITIPLFKDFLKNKSLTQDEKKERIEFHEATNTISKGHLVLSENLTAAEFKLLKYLITNPEKVIERNDVITAVWHDAKSTAGVTDQAIDQLIFRLRKKIEEDPNNPQHLVTVKGRGFKFSP